MKAVIIGLRHPHSGSIGPSRPGYIHSFRQLEGVDVVAYCEDTDLSLLDEATEFDPGAGIYTNLDDLLACEDFDIACVTLPANEVPRTGIKLAEAGKHFFMEKQFARRAADLKELVRVVRRTGVKVLPGYPHRFNPVAQDLRRMIDQGVLGRPLDLEMRLVTSQVRPGMRPPDNFRYTLKEQGGGILHMEGCHYVDLMRFIMGCEVKSVQAMTGRPVGYIEEPLEDVAISAFEFENGAYGSLHVGFLQSVMGGYDTAMVFRGMDGEAHWTPLGSSSMTITSVSPLWKSTPTKVFEHDFAPIPKPGYGGNLWNLNILQRFISDIRSDRDPALTIEDALHALQLIEAVYESGRTQRRVEVEYGV
ncbi:MAG: Gfo/Idh/MocA family oxidoreductase [SAR202 cluster bacterium]|nr:Gfo/Idh/MocA family oxidoreductase [SAR202 cluster bacterium]